MGPEPRSARTEEPAADRRTFRIWRLMRRTTVRKAPDCNTYLCTADEGIDHPQPHTCRGSSCVGHGSPYGTACGQAQVPGHSLGHGKRARAQALDGDRPDPSCHATRHLAAVERPCPVGSEKELLIEDDHAAVLQNHSPRPLRQRAAILRRSGEMRVPWNASCGAQHHLIPHSPQVADWAYLYRCVLISVM